MIWMIDDVISDISGEKWAGGGWSHVFPHVHSLLEGFLHTY